MKSTIARIQPLKETVYLTRRHVFTGDLFQDKTGNWRKEKS